jgi:heat shock protein HtpX
MSLRLNVYDEIAKNKRRSILLMLMFIVLLTLFGYAIDWLFRASGSVTITVFIGALIWTLISFFFSSSIVLALNGARKADPKQYPYLVNIVEGLSLAAGLPVPPEVYIIDTPAMNAFATGKSPKKSYVAFTTGLLEKLDRQEIEGVAAHEIAHIANNDIRVQTIAALIAGFFVMLADIAYRLFYWSNFAFTDREKERNNAAVYLFLFLLAIIAAFFANLIKLALSREREYLADATAALLTRNPEGLASALEKIALYSPPFERANAATAHLFIFPPIKKGGLRGFLANLLSTHPPIEERIKRLRSL